VILVVARDSPALLVTLAAFPVYWSVKRALMRGLPAPEAPPVRLPLLRVFGHDSRSERLLDELTLRWRPIGTVELIAGRDLVFRNIDPQELYTFLTGGLAREFVKDDDDLALRHCSRNDALHLRPGSRRQKRVQRPVRGALAAL
jgi:hypothetical protein